MKPRSQLFHELYDQLRKLAEKRLANERPRGAATSLVHEVYIKLRRWGGAYENEGHFLATASAAMRQILVDRARLRRADKRNSSLEPISISTCEPVTAAGDVVDVLLLDELLNRLTEFDSRAAQVTEMRIFLGLNLEETAGALGVSIRTVKRDWSIAKTWLKAELETVRSISDKGL